MQFYLPLQKVLALCRRPLLGPPFGHPNSLEIALARGVFAKVHARATLNAKERTFGGPRVPKGVKMEPIWSQIGTQNVLKIEVSKKCRKWFGPIIYYICTNCRHSPKTSLFDASKQAKCKSFPRGASDTVSEVQSGAHGVEKCREWNPPGAPRVAKGHPMPSKISTPLEDCLRGCF